MFADSSFYIIGCSRTTISSLSECLMRLCLLLFSCLSSTILSNGRPVSSPGGGQGAQVLMANEAAGALHQLTELRRSFRNLGSPWQ